MHRVPAVLVLLCAVATAAVANDSFQALGTADGSAVLWFAGDNVTASIDATVLAEGVLTLAGVDRAFSASGRAIGSGGGNLSTLAVNAWAAFTADGTTADGVRVTLRGGISVDGLDAAATGSTGGKGWGRFYLVITVGTEVWICEGEAIGEAGGGFVVPDDPHTMQLAGSGSFTLAGDLSPWAPPAEGADPDWPDDLLTQLNALFAALSEED